MALSSKRIIQCDLSGNEIRSFENAKEAADSMDSKWATSIYRSIRYGSPAFGYLWKYEGTKLTKRIPQTPGKRRKVVSRNIATGETKTHESISKASRDLRMGISSIESALQTGCKAKGYTFSYLGEDPIPPAKKNAFKKAIIALDDKDEVMREYPSVQEAAKELDVTIGAIYQCLAKDSEHRRCRGYRFRYK